MVWSTNYTHHTTVDGSNTYGNAIYGFPRRNVVGAGYESNASSGSRSNQERINTAYTAYYIS